LTRPGLRGDLLVGQNRRASASEEEALRLFVVGQRRSQSYPERSSARIELSGTQKAVRDGARNAGSSGQSELLQHFAPTTNPVER